MPNEKCAFVRETDKVMVKTSKEDHNAPVYWAWDQLAMAITLDRNVILDQSKAYTSVELYEVKKRGLMKLKWTDDCYNVTIPTKISKEKYERHILKAVCE